MVSSDSKVQHKNSVCLSFRCSCSDTSRDEKPCESSSLTTSVLSTRLHVFSHTPLPDFLIVILSLFEIAWLIIIGSLAGFNPKILRLLRIFRVVRALRVLRTITFFQSLQIIVTTLLRSIPAWGSISVLLLLVLCMYSYLCELVHGVGFFYWCSLLLKTIPIAFWCLLVLFCALQYPSTLLFL